MMNRFSSFCVALSAAALLTGGLTGQAQSEEPEGGWSATIDGVDPQKDRDEIKILHTYYSTSNTTFEDPNWTGFSSEPSSPRDRRLIRRLGWSPRDVRSHDSFDDWTGGVIDGTLYLGGGHDRKLLIDMKINPKTFNPKLGLSFKEEYRTGPYITFSAMEVGPDGSFSKTLEDGRSIAGRIPIIDIDKLFDERERAMVATYSGLNGLKIYYNRYDNQYRDGYYYTHIDSLRRLMFFDSQHYSEANYRENFALAENLTDQSGKDRDNTKREHVERGKSLLGRDAGDLSVDVRVIVDKATRGPPAVEGEGWYKNWVRLLKSIGSTSPATHDAGPIKERSRHVKNVSCKGLSCTGMLGKLPTTVFTSDSFVPASRPSLPASRPYEDPENNVQVVFANQGIHLAVDRSENNPIGAWMVFGAWMDDAGFFVAPSGYKSRVPNRFGYSSGARMVAAVGERTGSPPTADATWRGSMVGTAPRGLSRDNFLRGEAELKFDMNDSTLDARFFNIRDYHRFGERYMSVNGKKPGQIVFPDIPVAADGSYERKYRRRVANHKGRISGAFYGTGHRETAGTFQVHGILGAFGAKKVEKAPVPEAPAN